MRLFNQVAIVGVGLIGGSIGLAIKKRKVANEIIGVSRHKKTLSLAKKRRAIDKGTQDIRMVKDADLVILATPVSTILDLAPKIAKFIKKDCIVTDVGSAKEEIVSRLSRVFTRYVGSHPLAGSEKRGVIHADAGIFKDSLCILTPTRNSDPNVQKNIRRLWQALGAKVINLSPARHDKILSFTSHLPHIAAFSLTAVIPKSYLGFAYTGLKDTTRIAASDHCLWTDIFLSNQKNITPAIERLTAELDKIKSAIKRKDKKLLNKILNAAKVKRETLG